jgi:hypothetical protein
MRVLVVVNESGQIVAATHAGNAAEGTEGNAGFYPLAGQTIVEVDVPHALRTLQPHERLRAILDHCVHADGRTLEPREQKKGPKYGV